MGKVELFTIVLNKPKAVYLPGELLDGKLQFKATKKFKINSISVQVSGYARVEW